MSDTFKSQIPKYSKNWIALLLHRSLNNHRICIIVNVHQRMGIKMSPSFQCLIFNDLNGFFVSFLNQNDLIKNTKLIFSNKICLFLCPLNI